MVGTPKTDLEYRARWGIFDADKEAVEVKPDIDSEKYNTGSGVIVPPLNTASYAGLAYRSAGLDTLHAKSPGLFEPDNKSVNREMSMKEYIGKLVSVMQELTFLYGYESIHEGILNQKLAEARHKRTEMEVAYINEMIKLMRHRQKVEKIEKIISQVTIVLAWIIAIVAILIAFVFSLVTQQWYVLVGAILLAIAIITIMTALTVLSSLMLWDPYRFKVMFEWAGVEGEMSRWIIVAIIIALALLLFILALPLMIFFPMLALALIPVLIGLVVQAIQVTGAISKTIELDLREKYKMTEEKKADETERQFRMRIKQKAAMRAAQYSFLITLAIMLVQIVISLGLSLLKGGFTSWKAIFEMLKNLGKKALKISTIVAKAIWSVAKGIWSAIKAPFTMTRTEYFEAIWQGIKDIASAILAKLEDFIETVLPNLLRTGRANITAWFRRKLKNIGANIVADFRNIGQAIYHLIKAIPKLLKVWDVSTWLKGWQSFEKALMSLNPHRIAAFLSMVKMIIDIGVTFYQSWQDEQMAQLSEKIGEIDARYVRIQSLQKMTSHSMQQVLAELQEIAKVMQQLSSFIKRMWSGLDMMIQRASIV